MSASETVASPVIGTGTTETVPSSVALTDPPTVGALQAQVTKTTALQTSGSGDISSHSWTTSSVPAPALPVNVGRVVDEDDGDEVENVKDLELLERLCLDNDNDDNDEDDGDDYIDMADSDDETYDPANADNDDYF
jgi:hypothetical protein